MTTSRRTSEQEQFHRARESLWPVRVNWPSILLWGFAATLALTLIIRLSAEWGLTRIDIAFILGLMVTPDRDRAKFIGSAIHFLNGFGFALLYGAVFESLRAAKWWLGFGMGLLHGVSVLVILLPVLPGMHPRMASDFTGPETKRHRLEPPGFLALNYGYGTPLVTIAAHAMYGLILGVFYQLR